MLRISMIIALLACATVPAYAQYDRAQECWNPRAGHFEDVRPGERQDDLDFSPHPALPTTRTALLMPLYNEDPAAPFARLAALDPELPLVLVNHWPLSREPTRVLRHPEFAQWCGTELTADWHTRFRTAAVVYGHLHIPRTTWQDGVRFEEVSLGYPREWRRRKHSPVLPRTILPAPGGHGVRPTTAGHS